MTRQRGDQRWRKFYVYISTVRLFRIISTAYIEDDANESARRMVLARGRDGAIREGRAKKRDFELCVARATQKFIASDNDFDGVCCLKKFYHLKDVHTNMLSMSRLKISCSSVNTQQLNKVSASKIHKQCYNVFPLQASLLRLLKVGTHEGACS